MVQRYYCCIAQCHCASGSLGCCQATVCAFHAAHTVMVWAVDTRGMFNRAWPLSSSSVVPPTLQSYDIATELVAQGVAMWCATKEEEGEGEEEGEREGRGEEGKEEGEEGETGEDEEAEEEEEKDADGGDEKEKDTDGGDEKEKDADGGDEEEKDADGGDEEEKETKEEAMQEKSLQVGSVASDEGGENSIVVAMKIHVSSSTSAAIGREIGLASICTTADGQHALGSDVHISYHWVVAGQHVCEAVL